MLKMPELISESSKEKEKKRNFEVATINESRLQSIEEFQEKIELIKNKGSLDTIMTMEFSFKIKYFVKHIEDFKDLARKYKVDFIMAPDNSQVEMAKGFNWKVIKELLENYNIEIEKIDYPDKEIPPSIGFFISKKGDAFAFPKYRLGESIPLHKIPNTSIGIAICGEINHIDPDSLKGIKVIYNPSEEGDDPMLLYRMLQEANGEDLTREQVEEIALQDEDMQYLLLDQEEYKKLQQKDDEALRKQVGEESFKKYFGDELVIEKDETVEERRNKFDNIINNIMELLSGDYDSMYIKEASGLVAFLREKKIPVIRADGRATSGVLNKVESMELKNIDVNADYTSFTLSL